MILFPSPDEMAKLPPFPSTPCFAKKPGVAVLMMPEPDMSARARQALGTFLAGCRFRESVVTSLTEADAAVQHIPDSDITPRARRILRVFLTHCQFEGQVATR